VSGLSVKLDGVLMGADGILFLALRLLTAAGWSWVMLLPRDFGVAKVSGPEMGTISASDRSRRSKQPSGCRQARIGGAAKCWRVKEREFVVWRRRSIRDPPYRRMICVNNIAQ